MRWLKRSFSIFTIGVVALLLYGNVALYRHPEPVYGLDGDVLEILQGIDYAIHEANAAARMQQLYPEGFVFTQAIFALGWCETLQHLKPGTTTYREGLEAVDLALRQIDSPEGRSAFAPTTPLPYGMFYRAWQAYVQGKRLQIQPDSLLRIQFEQNCAAIAASINASTAPYLESYPGNAWPADNIVGLAALQLHDRLYRLDYTSTRADWLLRIKATAKPLLPHHWNTLSQLPTDPVRGSSLSLMLCFLPEIDSAFSQEQYGLFKQEFLCYRLGLPGIREFPPGYRGAGDVDAGPIVAGVGSVSSIVAIRAAALNKDPELSFALKQIIHALLLPQKTMHGRRYLMGRLPVLDAFLCWCKSASPILSGYPWRRNFQLFSLLLIAALLLLLRRWKRHQCIFC